jgi:hypothetical protein
MPRKVRGSHLLCSTQLLYAAQVTHVRICALAWHTTVRLHVVVKSLTPDLAMACSTGQMHILTARADRAIAAYAQCNCNDAAFDLPGSTHGLSRMPSSMKSSTKRSPLRIAPHWSSPTMPPRVICQKQPFALSTEQAFQTALCPGTYAYGLHMNTMAADLSRRAMCQPTCHTRPDPVTLPKLHTLPLMPLKQLSQCWSMHKCHHAHCIATSDLPWVCPACMPRSFPQRASIQVIPLAHPPLLHHATQPLPVAVHQLAVMPTLKAASNCSGRLMAHLYAVRLCLYVQKQASRCAGG